MTAMLPNKCCQIVNTSDEKETTDRPIENLSSNAMEAIAQSCVEGRGLAAWATEV